MARQLKLTKFSELSIADPFFDSLKAGCAEFPDRFAKKANEELYVVVDDKTDELSGMVYLKMVRNGRAAKVQVATPERDGGKPVLRFNGLPITTVPTTCAKVKLKNEAFASASMARILARSLELGKLTPLSRGAAGR